MTIAAGVIRYVRSAPGAARNAAALLLLSTLAVIGGCATTGPGAAPGSLRSDELLGFDEAVTQAVASLAREAAYAAEVEAAAARQQAGALERARRDVEQAIGNGAAAAPVQTLIIDPPVDGRSGERTALSRELEERTRLALGTHGAQLGVVPFGPDTVRSAALLLTGTIALEVDPLSNEQQSDSAALIHLSLTSLKSGNVVGHAVVRAWTSTDITPSNFYRDSPVVVMDEVVRGYIATASRDVGQRADAAYMERLYGSALIARGIDEYDRGDFNTSVGTFREAGSGAAGEQLRDAVGNYLSNERLDRNAEAEKAFGRVVALGIANYDLNLKFLFDPGSTNFISQPALNRRYPAQLKQIAAGLVQTGVCVDVIGHASRTGSDEYNVALSKRRAEKIRSLLIEHAADREAGRALGAEGTIQTHGVGFRENIVGLPIDDMRTAPDRRVSFKVRPCGS